ncbi:MAG: DUF5317 family protein [Anaerolineales bacterium]|nr:DUF5317 family protein [Anaerolineales bacterium]
MIHAKWSGMVRQPPALRAIWLVTVGFLPQLMAFYLTYTRSSPTDELASLSLVCSQLVLLVLTLANLRLPGMPLRTLGLSCTPTIGERISRAGKGGCRERRKFCCPGFADRFVSPPFISCRFVFSLGDVRVAAGTF